METDALSAFTAIVDYLKSNLYPPGSSKNEKRAIRQQAKSFRLKDGVLYHIHHKKETKVVTDNEEKERIIRNMHSEAAGGGHFGQNVTLAKISERFWWRGMSDDVRLLIRGCGPCQRTNPSNKAPPSTLHPVQVRYINIYTLSTFVIN